MHLRRYKGHFVYQRYLRRGQYNKLHFAKPIPASFLELHCFRGIEFLTNMSMTRCGQRNAAVFIENQRKQIIIWKMSHLNIQSSSQHLAMAEQTSLGGQKQDKGSSEMASLVLARQQPSLQWIFCCPHS